MDDKLDIRFAQSENLVLGEMERIRVLTDQRIDQLQANLEELKQYYRITKLENDNTALLLRMINDLQNRVEQLERKTAWSHLIAVSKKYKRGYSCSNEQAFTL